MRLLLSLLLVAGVTAEEVAVVREPARWRVSGEGVDLPGDEVMGLAGVHHDLIAPLPALPWIYLGAGGYGAVTGERGGFFVVGGTLGARLPLPARFGLDLAGFAGGGGGAAAGQGGGLMLRAQALATWSAGPLELQAGAAAIDFANGDIEGVSPVAGLTLRDDLFLIEAVDGARGDGAILAPRPTLVAAQALTYRTDGGSRRRGGGPLAERIDCAGVVFARTLVAGLYAPLELQGALGGEAAGYMEVMGGLGWREPLGSRLALDLRLLAGAGGGGDVDTGGGVLLRPMLHGGVRLADAVWFELGGGWAWAPDGDFAAGVAQAGLAWAPEALEVRDAPLAVLPGDALGRDAWTVTAGGRAYLPHDRARVRGGARQEERVDLVDIGLEKPLAPWLALTGHAGSAFAGGVGGYSEGLFGVRLGAPLGPVALAAHAQAGAGGGGGMDTGDGLIALGTLQARVHVWRGLALTAEAGRMDAHAGTFSADVIGLGLAVGAERALWR